MVRSCTRWPSRCRSWKGCGPDGIPAGRVSRSAGKVVTKRWGALLESPRGMRMQEPFRIVALTPAGQSEPTLVLAADRASCLGVVNAEIGPLPLLALERLAGKTRSPFGLKLRHLAEESIRVVEEFAPRGLGWLTLDAPFVLDNPETLARLADLDIRVIVEAI